MPHLSRGRLASLLVALLAAITVTITVTIGDPATPPPAAPAATAVDGPDADTARDDRLPVTAAQQAQLERTLETADSELTAPLREPADPSRTPAGVLEGPLAAQEFPGCRTRFVRNYSSRNGARPGVIVWHQTVSYDRPGWADQDVLTAMANQPSSGVSWHLLIGRADGLCTFSVPLHMKAWTQGNANPVAVGIEVQAYGTEPTYVQPTGERRLLAVTRELGKRLGIPMQRGLVRFDANCTPTVVRKGIVEHSDLGSCGGGHADVTPWSTTRLIAKLGRARPSGRAALTAHERRAVDCLQAKRRIAKRNGGYDQVSPRHKREADACEQQLRRANHRLHDAGLTTPRRRARHAYLHKIL